MMLNNQTVNTPNGRAGRGMVISRSFSAFLLTAVVGTTFAEPPIMLSPPPTNPSLPIALTPAIQPLPPGSGLAPSAPAAVTAPQAAAPAAASPVGACSAERIATVEVVNLHVMQNSIEVSAEGEVSSAGWKDSHLVRVGAIDNGHTLVFDFVACPPQGFAAQVMQAVSGRGMAHVSPEEVSRIVVRARNNSQTVYVRDFR